MSLPLVLAKQVGFPFIVNDFNMPPSWRACGQSAVYLHLMAVVLTRRAELFRWKYVYKKRSCGVTMLVTPFPIWTLKLSSIWLGWETLQRISNSAGTILVAGLQPVLVLFVLMAQPFQNIYSHRDSLGEMYTRLTTLHNRLTILL